tara:strand:+ start:453 stop:893 length:441 start_codon:yes stop_codon:yes gene_type:complete
MINTIRIRALDFIGSEYEEYVWKSIQNAKKTCHNEFKILFYVDDATDMTNVANAVSKNTDYLQLKTVIKLWKKCKDDYVFLDVMNNDCNNNANYRFAIQEESPLNVIKAMNFIVKHSEVIKRSHFDDNDHKRQKRNDSSDYDYNKK